MEKEYLFETLDLVKNPTFLERLLRGIINSVGYSFGFASLIHKVSKNGLKPSERSWYQQSRSYESDGELIYRHVSCENGLTDHLDDIKTIPQLVERTVEKNGPRRALGFRKIIEETEEMDETTKKMMKKCRMTDYNWLTYTEFGCVIKKWTHFFLCEGFGRERKMAIFADSSHEWLIVALSLVCSNSPFVTVYTSLQDDSVVHALNLTECSAVFVDSKTLNRVLDNIEKFPKIDTIVMSSKCGELGAEIAAKGMENVKIVQYCDVCDKDVGDAKPEPAKEIDPDEMMLIMFTSGSTGVPKGVMISHTNVLAVVSSIKTMEKMWTNTVYPAYLPLAHILEFCSEITMLYLGGVIGYGHPLSLITKGPMLADGCQGDLNLLKPKVMAAVPLILERLRKRVLEKIGERSRMFQMFFQTCYNMKAYFLGKGYDTPIIDRIVFSKLNQLFGGNVEYAFIGGAMVQRETEEFFNVCFGKFKQAYGLTETCCGGTMSDLMYTRCGICGPPISCTELKLVPYEEGDYNPGDANAPRGEVALSGKQVSLGYFKEEQLTKDAFKLDSNGKRWFYTGDIAEMNQDGTFKIIDRKKDIIKLVHGEYVALAKVEAVIAQSKFVEIICVMPNSTNEKLVALVVPNQLHIESIKHGGDVDKTTPYADLLKNQTVLDAVIADLHVHIKQAKLTKFEIPSTFNLLPDAWTPDNNLVTPSLKIKRHEVAKVYKHLLV